MIKNKEAVIMKGTLSIFHPFCGEEKTLQLNPIKI
jgi:hypothetical protein